MGDAIAKSRNPHLLLVACSPLLTLSLHFAHTTSSLVLATKGDDVANLLRA